MRARIKTIHVEALSKLGAGSAESEETEAAAAGSVVSVVVAVVVAVAGSVIVSPLSAVEMKENEKDNNRQSKKNVIPHLRATIMRKALRPWKDSCNGHQTHRPAPRHHRAEFPEAT